MMSLMCGYIFSFWSGFGADPRESPHDALVEIPVVPVEVMVVWFGNDDGDAYAAMAVVSSGLPDGHCAAATLVRVSHQTGLGSNSGNGCVERGSWTIRIANSVGRASCARHL